MDVTSRPFDGFTAGSEEKGTEGWKTAMRGELVCLIRSMHLAEDGDRDKST